MRRLAIVAVFGLSSACHGAPADDSDFCASAPPADWQTFGSGFVRLNCQTCHASTSLDREGAPEDVVFDTAADVWSWKDSVLSRAASDPPTMPPLGGTTDDDRYLLKVWLECGVEGE